jgi:WD40 repeat protein
MRALGEGITGVLDTLFGQLASNANHGPVLVERSLGYLASARYGLTEDEMLDVLTADDVVWDDFDKKKHHDVGEHRLPVVVWSRLSLDLEPYLTERAAPSGTVIAFYHRQLAERVEAKFLAGYETQKRHGDLALYFSKKPAWLDEGRKAPNARRAAELVFQQRSARQWAEAEATLFDCPFLFAKVVTGMVLDLDDDYRALLRDAPGNELPRRADLLLVHGALRLSLHVVTNDPVQLAPQMIGRLLVHRDKLDVAKLVDEISTAAQRPWFRPLHPYFDAPDGALIGTLDCSSVNAWAIAMTPDGKRAVSAYSDNTLRVWDLENGRVLRTLGGHSGIVSGVAVTAEGNLAVSSSRDNKLKVWDLDTGSLLHTLIGHTGWVNAVAVTPDGKRAVSASWDRTLKVWDLESGRVLYTLKGHSNPVFGMALTPNSKWAISASWDKTLKVWNLESGQSPMRSGHARRDKGTVIMPLRTLEGHLNYVDGAAVTPDGKWAISASSDKTLKVWELETGRVLRTLEGHTSSVEGVAVTPNGKRAVSASRDHTLKVWDLDSGLVLSTLKGHYDIVWGAAVTPDGRRAVSASSDGTLKVWDIETSRAARTPDGHATSVDGVAVTPDGKRVVAASRDKTLKAWNQDTGALVGTLYCEAPALCCASVDRQLIAIGDEGGRVLFVSLED